MPPRSYTSDLRAEQAARTRDRVVRAAAHELATHGYDRTTLARVAERAGVSVETVKAHGPKRALLLAAFEVTFAGSEGRGSLVERPEGKAVADAADPDAFLDGMLDLVAAANARVAPLWAAFTAAAQGDEAVAAELDALLDRRRTDLRASVDLLAAHGFTVHGPREHAAEALSYLLTPEGHTHFVAGAGWSDATYRAWLRDAVLRLVAAPPGVGPVT
ncbi:TetR/AcrR family transcriptional regulator [Cellulosimicrobium marinum]|uniref:TetR/AcrR family transcriptional regulator n=1 Tax=Cellulosimicrobium marinum TaxID=1638992 RepID=UPI001E4BF5B6|nr:TetR/AcrR family transcriptional regulator [Cellulosimicrobium marinum]MCB7135922.1 TetR/AcrR family transcriptional regulator [Cellulosimicrobium marinum]